MTAMPEAETYAMMRVGLGWVGFMRAARRKIRHTTASLNLARATHPKNSYTGSHFSLPGLGRPASTHAPLSPTFPGEIKVAAVQDPFGNRFAIIENPLFDTKTVR